MSLSRTVLQSLAELTELQPLLQILYRPERRVQYSVVIVRDPPPLRNMLSRRRRRARLAVVQPIKPRLNDIPRSLAPFRVRRPALGIFATVAFAFAALLLVVLLRRRLQDRCPDLVVVVGQFAILELAVETTGGGVGVGGGRVVLGLLARPFQGLQLRVAEHGDLVVGQGALDAVGVVAQAIVFFIILLVVVVFFLAVVLLVAVVLCIVVVLDVVWIEEILRKSIERGRAKVRGMKGGQVCLQQQTTVSLVSLLAPLATCIDREGKKRGHNPPA